MAEIPEVEDDDSEDGQEFSPDEAVEVTASAVEVDADEPEPDVEFVDPDAGNRSLAVFDPLQRYLVEIRRYPILSREEEHELAVRYVDSQDVDAAYRLVTGNLRLVVMVAREYQRATRNLLDLIQEGNMGLMEAVKKFDPYRGVRFPSYAVWWIRAYIIRYLMNNWRMVKVGTTQAQRKLFFNLQKEKEKLIAEGVWPHAKLIAQRLDVKESEVLEMEQRLSSRDLSVDTSADNEGRSMLDYLPSGEPPAEDRVAKAEFQAAVSARIRAFGGTLKDKEKAIFESRLLAEQPLTLQEIGDQYGISRERVRQIEERLKKKLRAYLTKEIADIEEVVGER